ncbi:CPBP family intramembrane glutamic endopeptidase [Enterococcus faecalis]
MNLRKTSMSMILIYLVAFFGPMLFLESSANMVINATTILYILGAMVMIGLYLKNTEPTLVKQQATLTSPVFIFLLGVSGIFLALIIQGIIFSIEMSITGTPATSQNTQNIVKIILMNPLFIVATTVGGPIMEEFVFRRSFINLIQPFSNFWLAAIISSAIFSIAHQDGHFFVYFALGFFFSILYKKTGSIWTSIIAHCGMNTIVIIAQLALHYGYLQAP